jgi:hypothetical protein
MSPNLADATRQQLPQLKTMMDQLGTLQTVTFKGVGPGGADNLRSEVRARFDRMADHDGLEWEDRIRRVPSAINRATVPESLPTGSVHRCKFVTNATGKAGLGFEKLNPGRKHSQTHVINCYGTERDSGYTANLECMGELSSNGPVEISLCPKTASCRLAVVITEEAAESLLR